MKDKFITITGFKHYYGLKPFQIGNLLRCSKEPDNSYDLEAIKVIMPMIGTVGYVANSPDTVAGGTMSAGRIYDHVKKRFYARVMFTTFTKVICKIEFGNPELFEQEYKKQVKAHWDDDWDE
jgi:hypothetical protein